MGTTIENLAAISDKTWRKYEALCWSTSASEDQRQQAFERWMRADDQLAEHRRAEQARRARGATDKLPAVRAS